MAFGVGFKRFSFHWFAFEIPFKCVLVKEISDMDIYFCRGFPCFCFWGRFPPVGLQHWQLLGAVGTATAGELQDHLLGARVEAVEAGGRGNSPIETQAKISKNNKPYESNYLEGI